MLRQGHLFVIRTTQPNLLEICFSYLLIKKYEIGNFSRSGACLAPEFPAGSGEEVLAKLHRHHPYTEERLLTR